MERRRSRGSRRRARSVVDDLVSARIERPFLLGITCVVIVLALTLGGASNRVGLRFDLIVFSGAILLGFAVWAGALSAFQKLPFWFRLFVALVMALPLIQLIPLPPSIWRSFPGRETSTGIFDLVGAGQAFHPLSLDPLATLVAWLSLMPAFAIFLAAITLEEQERRYLAMTVVGVGALSIAIGLFQFGSRGAIFNFYDSTHRLFLLGFFANRNHQALFLCLTAVWFAFLLQTNRRTTAHVGLALILMLLLVGGGILATFSRSGAALFVLLAAVLGYRAFGSSKRGKLIALALGIGVLVAAGFLAAFNDIVANFSERYDSVGDDARWNFWVVSWHILSDNFPIGSGIGTFVPIYASYEPLPIVDVRYVNHAHNDYLELLLETGIAGAIMLVLALALFARGVARLRPWNREFPSGILLLVPMLVAFHSVVDYPLRTIAITSVVALAVAEILAGWRSAKDGKRTLMEV